MYISLQPKYVLKVISSMRTNNQTKNGEYKEPNSLELTAKLRYSPAFIFCTIYDTWNVVINHGGRQAVIFKEEGGKGMNEKRLRAALWLTGWFHNSGTRETAERQKNNICLKHLRCALRWEIKVDDRSPFILSLVLVWRTVSTSAVELLLKQNFYKLALAYLRLFVSCKKGQRFVLLCSNRQTFSSVSPAILRIQ